MTHAIGYYTSYNSQTRQPGILDRIQQEWGTQLEHMTYEQKIVMRGALADYIVNKPVHQPSPHRDEVTLMQTCIETAGVDWNVWDADPELCQCLEACESLHESDVEGLIEAITAQIRGRVYASRSV
jgi:hypothetical protein